MQSNLQLQQENLLITFDEDNTHFYFNNFHFLYYLSLKSTPLLIAILTYVKQLKRQHTYYIKRKIFNTNLSIKIV